jgi:hypothetical protein
MRLKLETGSRSPMKLVTRCIAEDRPRFHRQTFLFALSAARCPGPISAGVIDVGYVEQVDPTQAARLRALGATVRIVERVHPRHPPANKLRMFEATDDIEFDILVAADCDIAFVGDPVPVLPQSSIGLRPADRDCMPASAWQELFAALGIPLREAETFPWRAEVTTRYPYFNSGFVSVPRQLVVPLGKAWHAALMRVDDYLAGLDRRPPWAFFADQLGLSAALLDTGLPVSILPPTVNVPSHLGRAAVIRVNEAPVVVHYHDFVTAGGYLLPTGAPLLDTGIARVNNELASAVGGLPPRWLRARAWLAMVRTRLRGGRHLAASLVRRR